MDTKKLIITIGTITLLISITTWILDINGIVEPCIYCRNERTVMGLLGLLMVLPKHKYLTMYLAIALGFYGAYVAADQLFNNMLDAKIGLMFSLATGALFIILGQIFALWVYLFEKNQK